MITAMPLLYGRYTVTRGPGTFSLEPPLDLNLMVGWPLYKESARRAGETQYASYRERVVPNRQSAPVAGLAPTPAPPAENSLIRVEPAAPVEVQVAAATPAPTPPLKPTATPKGGKVAKNKKGTPTPSPTASAAMVAQNSPVPRPRRLRTRLT